MADTADHLPRSLDWVASERGTGYVGTCACRWETPFVDTRKAASQRLAAHVKEASQPAEPRRRRKARATKTIVVEAPRLAWIGTLRAYVPDPNRVEVANRF
jgi:hypothetical protein